jgi:hypothetical protein
VTVEPPRPTGPAVERGFRRRLAPLDLGMVRRSELVGIAAGVVLMLSLIALPWYSLDETPTRRAGGGFVCGAGHLSCTGFSTFPLLRWFLVVAALAPVGLAFVIARGHPLGWLAAEASATLGFAAMLLVGYNGILDRPGVGVDEAGIQLAYGYAIALLATIAIVTSGMIRSVELGASGPRRPPGSL